MVALSILFVHHVFFSLQWFLILIFSHFCHHFHSFFTKQIPNLILYIVGCITTVPYAMWSIHAGHNDRNQFQVSQTIVMLLNSPEHWYQWHSRIVLVLKTCQYCHVSLGEGCRETDIRHSSTLKGVCLWLLYRFSAMGIRMAMMGGSKV